MELSSKTVCIAEACNWWADWSPTGVGIWEAKPDAVKPIRTILPSRLGNSDPYSISLKV